MRQTRIVVALLAGWLGGSVAVADRVAGLAGIPPPARVNSTQPATVATPLLSGVVSDVRSDGSQVAIDGKWFILKRGRSLLMRDGVPIDTSALAKGQKLKYSLASATPGEMALGVVYVP